MRSARTGVSALWPRIGALVRRRPGALIAAVLAVLIAGAPGNLKGRETLDFAEQFRSTPESVVGLHQLQAKFPPGQAGPVDILVDQGVLANRLQQLGSDVAHSVDLVGFSKDGDHRARQGHAGRGTRSPRRRRAPSPS